MNQSNLKYDYMSDKMMIHIMDDTICKLRWVKNDVILKLMEWGFSKQQNILWELKLLGDNHIMFKISTNITESYAIAFDIRQFPFTGLVPVIGVEALVSHTNTLKL